MGNLYSNPAKLSVTSNQTNPAGLCPHRTKYAIIGGNWLAASAASFRAGAPVMLNSSGEVVISDKTALLGVAFRNKITLGKSVVIDEPVAFTATGQTKTLAHPNISNVVVRETAGMGTAKVVTDDYTTNDTNGTITSVLIDSTVYVSYTWSLTASDYQFDGHNFYGGQDEVTFNGRRVAIIEAPADIYTTEYDTSKKYVLAGAGDGTGSNIYVNASGLFTSTSTSTVLVGKCIHVPSASDPFLGFHFVGMVAANT